MTGEEENEEEIANFLELWSEYGKSFVDAMRKEPNDKLWKDCMRKVKNKISNSQSYRPQTLRHHLYNFGQGTKRRGTQALGTTGNFKDRSGETERLAHQSLFFDYFISCSLAQLIALQL